MELVNGQSPSDECGPKHRRNGEDHLPVSASSDIKLIPCWKRSRRTVVGHDLELGIEVEEEKLLASACATHDHETSLADSP